MRRRHLPALCALCALILAGGCADPAAAALDRWARGQGWDWTGAPAIFKGQELYDHVDGGADPYFAFGFRAVAVREARKGSIQIRAEVYDMGGPDGARGIWANEIPPPGPGIHTLGPAGRAVAGQAYFWSGRFYGKAEFITADGAAPPVDQTLAFPAGQGACGSWWDRPLPGSQAGAIVHWVPSPVILSNLVYLGEGNPLALAPERRALAAAAGAGRWVLSIQYPDAVAANQALVALKSLPAGAFRLERARLEGTDLTLTLSQQTSP